MGCEKLKLAAVSKLLGQSYGGDYFYFRVFTPKETESVLQQQFCSTSTTGTPV